MASFDYVIVGGGSAGCVLANRLTADPAIRVLLLEAGPVDRDPLVHAPAGLARLMKSGHLDWRYFTAPQEHLDGRTLYCPRGKVLGGSSATNGMVAVRGIPSDYDNWRQLGLRGWSYDDVLPYFRRLETYLPRRGDHLGADGPIRITRFRPRGPLEAAWIAAGQQAGHPHNDDFNGKDPEGVGAYDRNVFRGRRQSASLCYLRPALRRPNLQVITGATVTRVIVEQGRAVGVSYRRKGQDAAAQAAEIILSGGVINSPQLLMLSGIGNAQDLLQHDIRPALDLKGVGRNLHDHLIAAVKVGSALPVSYLNYSKPHRVALAALQYATLRTGLAAEPGPAAAGFLKSDPSLEEPDVQFHFVPIVYGDSGRQLHDQHGFMAMCNVCRPRSRGAVTLRSSDPYDSPRIDPNYFADPYDRRTMVAGLRLARQIFAQPAFRPYYDAELSPGVGAETDEALEAHVRASAESIYHPVGSCRMGTDEEAVVDERLRVRGIRNLRIVDASVMPQIISGNTNLATMMIAEKAADMLLAG